MKAALFACIALASCIAADPAASEPELVAPIDLEVDSADPPTYVPIGAEATPVELVRGHLVATDIDETLTISNEEWERQVDDPAYDPVMRPDASTLMQGYADKGYTVVYVTARWDGFELDDGRSAGEATTDWLVAHGFPVSDGTVYLAPDEDPEGENVHEYKAGVLEDLERRGFAFDWAYGNAETDIEAFLDAGSDPSRTFLVGELAGQLGVVGIPDADAFTEHVAEHLPTVPEAGG
jgi:hypothetical protein